MLGELKLILGKLFSPALLAIPPAINMVYAANVKKSDEKYDYFPKASVLVYAWQAGNVIERSIKNFLELDYPRDKMELIIYDNCSTDETREISERYVSAYPGLIKYYKPDNKCDRKAPVLDAAIECMAQGEILAMTDPDGVREKDWLKKMAQPFKDEKIGAAVGPIGCGNYWLNHFTKMRAVEDAWLFDVAMFGSKDITDFQPFCGANYTLRKSAWEDVGGHGNGLVEDIDMALRLYNKGWKTAVTGAKVWQEEVENLRQYFRQRTRWYSFDMNSVLSGRNIINKALGSIPATMEISSAVSLLTFAYGLASGAGAAALAIGIAPFLMSNAAMAMGFYKTGKKDLIKYVPTFLTFDSMLQLSCLLYARTKRGVFDKVMKHLSGKEPHKWPLLADGKYYSSGTEIRTDI